MQIYKILVILQLWNFNSNETRVDNACYFHSEWFYDESCEYGTNFGNWNIASGSFGEPTVTNNAIINNSGTMTTTNDLSNLKGATFTHNSSGTVSVNSLHNNFSRNFTNSGSMQITNGITNANNLLFINSGL